MAIKDIIVHLDNSASMAARLETAIAYATKFKAQLRGLHIITHNYYEPDNSRQTITAENIEELFNHRTTEAGVSSEWVLHDCSVSGCDTGTLLSAYAYYTDLIILGQHSINKSIAEIVEKTVLSCGKQVLVVPEYGSHTSAANRVLIAWKSGRESVRTINDGIPILKTANKVKILECKSNSNNMNLTGNTDNLIKYLSKHNIIATGDTISSNQLTIGDMILNYTCEEKIDLIMMGAAKPGRSGKPELSPIVKYILEHQTAPVLLAH